MATLTGHLVADTYKALLKLIDNDILTASEKQISDGFGGGSNVFIDQNGFLRAAQFKVTGGTSSQFLKGNGSLDSNTYLTAAVANTLYLPIGSTTTAIAEGSRLYFTTARVLATTLTGFVATSGTVTASDTILTAIDKIWWNIVNGGGGGGGYVPYTGATQNLNLGTYGLLGDFVQFNVSNSAVPTAVGTMSWNNTDGTADLKLKGGNVTLQIGQEQVTRVVNKTGSTLLEANYHAVYISGAQGQRLKVDLALAVTDGTSAGTLGLVTETIANNGEGFITSSGLVNEINTTGSLQGETWADGDILYLSPITAGDVTNVKPLAPEHTVIIGFVVYAHAIHGKIYVKVDNGYEIEELHDVQVIDRTDTDILQWYEDDLVWRNIQFATALDNAGGIIGLGDINYVPRFDGTNSISNSRIFDDLDNVIIGGTVGIIPNPFGMADMLTVLNGNIAIEGAYSYRIDTHQILKRTNATGEFRIGTDVIGDFITLYAGTSERARLTAAGYLGVGLIAPSSMIHAKDSTAYGKIIIDNTGLTGGGSFSARQNGTETAIFGISGAWALNTTSDAAVIATRAGKGIQFYTNGSSVSKMGINSDGNVNVGSLPTYLAGYTQLIVKGVTDAGMLGVVHYDGGIRGLFSTLDSGVNIGSYSPHPLIFRTDDFESARIASDGKWLIGTATNDNVNLVQINGSVIATAFKKSGGTSIQFLKADGSVTSLTASAQGLDYDSATGDFYITTGYVIPLITTTTNWDTAYTNRITSLTTTGSSGNATLISNVLNIPTITLSGIGGQPISANLTSLSGLSYVSGSFVKMTGTGTFTLDTNTYYLASNPSSFIALTALSSAATGLTYNNTTGLFTLTVGYVIPTTTSATNWDTAYTNRITSATAPLSITSNIISMSQSSAFTDGFLSSTDWNTFNNKTSNTGTVTSVSGTGTVSGLTLTGTVTTTGSLTLGGTLSLTSLNVTTALGFTPVTNARTLTINGTTYDLTADRSWTISAGISTLTTTGTSGPATLVGSTLNVPNYSAGASAVRNVSTFTATSGQTTFTISGGYTVGLIDVFINGARLSTADYTATNSSTVVLGTGAVLNDIVDVVNYTATFTAGITGTGTANYLTKWTGTSTVSNSVLYDNGTNVGIGTITPAYKLDIVGTGRFSSSFYLPSLTTNYIPKIGVSGLIGNSLIYDDGTNIGIGTVSPSTFLHIIGANTSNRGQLSIQSNNVSNGARATWYYDTFNSGEIGTTGSNFYATATTDFLFYAGGAERMRILSTGFIGINTSSPSTFLHIIGANTSNRGQLCIQSNNASNAAAITFYYSTYKVGNIGSSSTDVGIESINDTGFYAGGAERMRITSGGSVQINTTLGTSTLNLKSKSGGNLITSRNASGGDGTIYVYGSSTSFDYAFNTYSVGNAFYLYNNGNYSFAGSNVSDKRLKENIEIINYNAIEKIMQLIPKSYNMIKHPNTKRNGFIAQEVKEIFPDLITGTETNEEYLGIDYNGLLSITIKAIQELSAEINQLKAK